MFERQIYTNSVCVEPKPACSATAASPCCQNMLKENLFSSLNYILCMLINQINSLVKERPREHK